jgi:predicted NBD/HSP70 family sugar kinase
LETTGLVVSDGVSKSNGGRKAVLYSIDPNYGYIIGQNHARTKLATSVYDLSLKTVYVNRIKSELTKSSISIENMKEEIARAIQGSGVPKDKFLGVGVTLPGQVNHREGVVNSMLNLNEWDNTPLQNIIERFTGLPACIYNDNRANVISCKWLGKIPEDANAVYINISEGVGVGVMIRGEVFSGSHSFAGELGHLEVRGQKAKCQCGNVGCIETLVCNDYIIEQVRKKYGLSTPKESSVKACVNEIIQMARDGNNGVYSIIKEATNNIIYIIDSVIKAYDPDKIIIYNPWLLHFNELFNELVDTVFGRCRWLKKNTLSIELDTSDVADNYGPVSIVLENLFNFNSENRIDLRLDKEAL